MPEQEMDSAWRLQTAVLWPCSGRDNYGEPQVGSPVEILVRWITKRMEALDALGNTIALDAQAVVNQEIAVGSLMWLGTLASWQGTGSAVQPSDLMQVKIYDEATDLKGRATRRTAGLMRFRDALPT